MTCKHFYSSAPTAPAAAMDVDDGDGKDRAAAAPVRAQAEEDSERLSDVDQWRENALRGLGRGGS